LRIVVEEGLDARFKRHLANAHAIEAGLGAMGLSMAAQEGHRLPQLAAVTIPEGIDDARVRDRLLKLSTSKSVPVSVRSKASSGGSG